MTDFFTADTHFCHARIIDLCARPFVGVDEMNETIVSNFNDRATADDTIYILGDACMGNLDESLEYIALINARTVLVPGNHDRPSRAYQRKGDIAAKIKTARERYLEYFDEVLLEPATGASVWVAPRPVQPDNTVLMMSHYPYEGDSHGEDRYAHLRSAQRGLPIIHGHVHTEWLHNKNQFNVGVDVNDFQLVSENEVLDWVKML